MFCSFVDVNGSPYMSAPITLVRLLLKISFHLYTLPCGKQFCPYLAANCRWISYNFISSDTKKRIIACCFFVVQTSRRAVIFTLTRHKRTTTEPHSQHTNLTLSYSMTRRQQCCQSHNENIPMLPFCLNLLRSMA
jgi:hypothetical protein